MYEDVPRTLDLHDLTDVNSEWSRSAPTAVQGDTVTTGLTSAGKEPRKRAVDQGTDDPEKKRPDHQLDGRGNLAETLAKVTAAMPCEPDQSLASVWGAVQASVRRVGRSRI